MGSGNQKIEKTGGNLGSDVDAITKLLGLFTDKEENTTTSGGTKTQQTMLSQEALNTLMKQAMEGNPGLAAIASSQKAPGLYNSTTRNLLTNDLLARSAGEVAVKSAPTVTSSTPQVISRVAPAAVNPLAALLGGGALLAKSGTAKATGKITDTSSKLLGGTGVGIASDAAVASIKRAAGFAGTDWSGTTKSIYDTVAQNELSAAGYESAGSGFLDFTSGASEFNTGLSNLMAGSADMAMPGVGQLMQAASGDYEGAAGSFALSQIPVIGPIVTAVDKLLLNGELSQTIGEAPAEIVQAGGDFLRDAGDAVSGIVDSIFGGCFITTATCKNRNLPDNCFELTQLRKLRDEYVQPNYPEQVEDYYATAPAIVAAIEAREDAAALWDELYLKYIVPCAQLSEQQRYETAHALYLRMVGVAKALAGINPEGAGDE